MKVLKAFALVLCLCFSIGTYAQADKDTQKSTKIEIINKHKYYIHTVGDNQTLYSIAKLYNIDVDDIISDNPTANKGIQKGQQLIIPINKKKEYVKHIVQAGETIWSICQKYNVTEKSIIAENKGAEKGLKTGDELFIVIQETVKSANAKKEDVKKPKEAKEKIVEHTVKQGETLYGISTLYKTEESEIIKLNPESKDGLKVGQILKIKTTVDISQVNTEKAKPVFRSSTIDSTFAYIVKKGETLSSIAVRNNITIDDVLFHNPEVAYGLKENQKIKIPVFNEKAKKAIKADESNQTKHAFDVDEAAVKRSDCSPSKHNDKFKVALFVPLYLSEVDNVVIPEKEVDPDQVNFKSFDFIGFYEGAMLAVDSLKKKGLNLELRVFDVAEDSASISKILKNPELKEMDLFIGPFYNKTLKIAAPFAEKNKIPIVSPFAPESQILKANEYVYKATPSMPAQLEYVAKYVADSLNDANVIVIHNLKQEDVKSVNNFYQSLKSKMLAKRVNAQINMMDYLKEGLAGIDKRLKKDKPNILIVLSAKEVFVSNLMTNLSKRVDAFPITVFGLPEWRNFTSIETSYLSKVRYHSFINNYVDYERADVKRFVSLYRDKYLGEPDKYTFSGYDISMYFMTALFSFGKDCRECLNKTHFSPLQTKFNFESSGLDGYENKYVNIYKIEDLKMIKVR